MRCLTKIVHRKESRGVVKVKTKITMITNKVNKAEGGFGLALTVKPSALKNHLIC